MKNINLIKILTKNDVGLTVAIKRELQSQKEIIFKLFSLLK